MADIKNPLIILPPNDGAELIANKVQTLTGNIDEIKYPSTKAVQEYVDARAANPCHKDFVNYNGNFHDHLGYDWAEGNLLTLIHGNFWCTLNGTYTVPFPLIGTPYETIAGTFVGKFVYYPWGSTTTSVIQFQQSFSASATVMNLSVPISGAPVFGIITGAIN